MKICSDCANAAFSTCGVYCMALGEQIWDERTAETCGLYEGPEFHQAPGDAKVISLNGRSPEHGFTVVRSSVAQSVKENVEKDLDRDVGATLASSAEAGVAPVNPCVESMGFEDDDHERTVTAIVEIGYFGRLRHGAQVLETLRRICELEFSQVEIRS